MPVGAVKTLAGGTATSDSTTAAQTMTIGKYCWRADYSGDAFYGSSTHTDSTLECFDIDKQDSQVDTTATPNTTTVPSGVLAFDRGSISC